MKPNYRPDNTRSTGIGGFLLHDAGLQAALLKVAEEGAAYARSIAPRATPHIGKGPVYAESFSVTKESGRTDSVGAMIVNDSDHAAHVEFDLSHTLAKTADYLNAKK